MEIWLDIPGILGYQVSDLGSVRNEKRVIAISTDAAGYKNVQIGKKRYLVHRLVASAFLGPSDKQVNHKNGIRGDNSLSNLEWVTQSENHRHAFRVLGRKMWSQGVYGADNPCSKRVMCTRSDGTVTYFANSREAVEAGEATNMNGVGLCCRGLRKTHAKSRWKYVSAEHGVTFTEVV